MSLQEPQPPAALQSNSVEARVIKQKVWDRCNVKNLNFMAAVVGREGSGKSLTSLKVAEAADPTFNASRVMFEPQAFLERLQEWKENGETKGKMVVADEAGVGLGVRTWYQKDQILFNQVLQLIRDENMGIIFTLPRLSELDSQARGRLHAFMEMTDLKAGEWAEMKFLNWRPTRDERDDIYRSYPRMRVGGSKRKVKRLRFGPPSQELVEEYQERKNEFQDRIYQEAIDEMDDEADEDEMSIKDVAAEIQSDGVNEYVSVHGGNGLPYIDHQLIRAEYELSTRDAKAVKSLLGREYSEEQLRAHTTQSTQHA